LLLIEYFIWIFNKLFLYKSNDFLWFYFYFNNQVYFLSLIILNFYLFYYYLNKCQAIQLLFQQWLHQHVQVAPIVLSVDPALPPANVQQEDAVDLSWIQIQPLFKLHFCNIIKMPLPTEIISLRLLKLPTMLFSAQNIWPINTACPAQTEHQQSPTTIQHLIWELM